MADRSELARRFLELHRKGEPLLLANAFDVGSARLLASLGFRALATTSAGHAGTLGRLDGGVSLEEALDHAGILSAATDLPVSADFENGYADAPDAVADNVRRAGETGLAGCSVEDFTRSEDDPIYEAGLAVARVEAAASAARSANLVLTARCENFLHGRADLADTVKRLQAYQEAGADVVYAPGLNDLATIREVTESVDVPVNVLCLPGGPTVGELASAGVARISVGSAFWSATMGALVAAGREWLEQGTNEFWNLALAGSAATPPSLRLDAPRRVDVSPVFLGAQLLLGQGAILPALQGAPGRPRPGLRGRARHAGADPGAAHPALGKQCGPAARSAGWDVGAGFERDHRLLRGGSSGTRRRPSCGDGAHAAAGLLPARASRR